MNKTIIVCDSCDKEADVAGLEKPWFHVATMVSTQQMATSLLDRLSPEQQEAHDFSNVLDYGDFCSLACIANWASARENLRSLDE